MPEPLRTSRSGVVTVAAVASSPDRHETITMTSPVTSNDLVTRVTPARQAVHVTAEHLKAPVSPTSADTATVLAAHLPTLLDEGVVGMPVWSESENITDPDGVDEHRADALADAILATPPPEPPPSVLPPDEPPGAGTPLPWTLRRQAEKATGTDLSRVRVHSTPEGRAAADRLQARAFTAGSQIVLGRNIGHLSDGGAGLRTLAHEIGHVLAPPANGKIGRDPDKPDDDADKKDKFVTWTAFQPPADTQAVIDAVPTYLESLKGVTWNQAALDWFGADEVANGTPTTTYCVPRWS